MTAQRECLSWHTFWILVGFSLSLFIIRTKHSIVYYRDGALRLSLPPRHSFSKSTASPFVGLLITSARLMLRNEQKRERRGDSTEGDSLVKQLICMYHIYSVGMITDVVVSLHVSGGAL
jgi:hypothetical protein